MATDSARETRLVDGTSPAKTKAAPLISSKLLLFMVAMVLANTGGSMYGPLLPLYLKELDASVVQIGLFFTLVQIIPLALQILGGWISDSLGRLRSIAMGSVAGVFSYLGLVLAPTWQWVLVGEGLSSVTRSLVGPSFRAFIAEESAEELYNVLKGSDMVFVTAGIGGGTGTGASPAISQISREVGALTIGVVTLPFNVEGVIRMENAEQGLKRLRDICDTVIVIPNDKLLDIVPNLSLNAAFKVADEVLMRSIKGITEMITMPGLVNLDFADLKTVMKRGGVAMIGLGEAEGENKAVNAVSEALNSPLLEVDISEATGALVNVTGGDDMTISEAERVVEEIYSKIDKNARIIWGTTIEPSLKRSIRAMLVITGVKSKQILGPSQRSLANNEFGIDIVK